MSKILQRLYQTCGALAGLFLIAIAVLILLQAGGRWLGIAVQGASDYAGYSMAAGSFLALAYTLGHGDHIRVTIVLQRFHGRTRWLMELWCLGAGSFLSAYFAWYAVKMVLVSYEINDISQGPDATPLWIPQIAVGFGAVVLAIAMIEKLVRLLMGGGVEEDKTPMLEDGGT
jgi:TRAP-type C4-dicarboxylate transport system permease small subunit